MKNLKSYLITDPKYYSNDKTIFKKNLQKALLEHKVDIACFRDKESKNIYELAEVFLQTCKEFQIKKILINSNFNLAKELNFTGVHLTSAQFCDIKRVKELNLAVAISCHNFEELSCAYENEVDFVTYSPIFYSPNKAKPLGVDELKRAISTFDKLKIIALGGIVSKNQIEQISKTSAYGFASIRYFI